MLNNLKMQTQGLEGFTDKQDADGTAGDQENSKSAGDLKGDASKGKFGAANAANSSDPFEQAKKNQAKILAVRGQTSPFNATNRQDPNIQVKYYGDGTSVGPVFYPNFKYVKNSY